MARVVSISLVGAVVLLCASSPASGNVFLAKDSGSAGTLSAAEVKGILFQEIQGFFGTDKAKHRVDEVEDFLRPLYVSLPKDAHGGLGPGTVRYALHRYFAQQHAWHIKGLEPRGGAWNETDPTKVLTDRVPSYVQSLFEDSVKHGFGLHELAVMATAVEHIVQTETVARVEAAYAVQRVSTEESLQEEALYAMLDTHELIYLLAIPFTDVEKIRKVAPRMNAVYPGWKDTQAFLRDTRGNLAYAERDRSNPFVIKTLNFQEVVHVVETVNDQFGHFQDIECRGTKSTLLEREYKGTGRVRLADFYGLALGGDLRFTENVDYLRQLGALDESDPTDLRLVVSNYMNGINNCFESSSYYSVCCLDECNPLLEHLERAFAAPEVESALVAAEVALLSSPTVVAPRNLSSTLLRKLDDIARTHGGKIPLHGRLFMQFLHHAFPRECPHPHVSGTTTPKSISEYRKAYGRMVKASTDELKQHGVLIPTAAPSDQTHHDLDTVSVDIDNDDSDLLPWSDEEELLADRVPNVQGTTGQTSSWLRVVVMIGAVSSLVYGLFHQIQDAQSAARHGRERKVYV